MKADCLCPEQAVFLTGAGTVARLINPGRAKVKNPSEGPPRWGGPSVPAMDEDRTLPLLKFHQAIFRGFAPVDAGIFFRVEDVFFALRAAALGLIRKKLDLHPAIRALEVADF